MTLATSRDAAALSYAALTQALGLATPRELEDLVISSVYAGLLSAQLDPKNQAVQVDSVAAMRDAAPGSLDGLLASLQAWVGRCDATLASLEAQMDGLRSDADRRAAEAEAWKQRMEKLVDEETKGARNTDATTPSAAVKSLTGGASVPGLGGGGGPSQAYRTQPRYGKRGSGQMDGSGAGDFEDEAMDVDDDDEDGKKRASRRKL